MRTALLLLLGLPALLPAAGTLDIYFVDVEGGAATLIVTPQKEALLMDAGWRRGDDRDAKRIAAAVKLASVEKIDYFITSHFHGDHMGGLPALAGLIPICKFIDHGEPAGPRNPRFAPQWETYLKVTQGKRWSVKPGEKIPLKGATVLVVASDGQLLDKPLGRASPNPFCPDAKLKEPDTGDDAHSVGFLVTMGKFRFLDLGDLSWNKEHELACPESRVGRVDVFQVSMHGMDRAGAPELVWSLKPEVVVMNNGPRKGGAPGAYEVVRKSPGLEDFWQLHYAVQSDAQHNTDERLIANLGEEKDCAGNWLKISATADGKYTVTNSRTGFSKSYIAR